MTTQKLFVAIPEKYWSHAGDKPPLRWELWIKQFNAYISMTDACQPTGSKLTDEQKNNMLIMLLGSEGLRQFHTHPIADSVASASTKDFCDAATSVFQKPVHKIRAHYEFNECRQESDETVSQYLLRLRALAADCDFHGESEYHIAIQLVLHPKTIIFN